MTFKPFGKNILIQPESKGKIIGDTAKFLLYGKVLAIGDEVHKVKVGDTIGYVLWGIKELVEKDDTKHYFLEENSDFILGIEERTTVIGGVYETPTVAA